MKYITNIIRILFLALFIFLLANGKVLLWLALFAVSLVAALIFGRVYCGYACPMNTLMIPYRMAIQKAKASNSGYAQVAEKRLFYVDNLGYQCSGYAFVKKTAAH